MTETFPQRAPMAEKEQRSIIEERLRDARRNRACEGVVCQVLLLQG